MANIGGVLGLAYNDTNEEFGNSIWVNATEVTTTEFSVNLQPTVDDWGWVEGAPDTANETSYLTLGGPNPELLSNLQINEYFDNVIVLQSVKPQVFEVEME